MADNVGKDDFVLAIISNIPSCYHSCDLRNYFSQFIETGGFICFHFRHRPEKTKEINLKDVTENDGGSSADSAKTLCCVIKVKNEKFSELLKYYNKHHWQNKSGDSIPQLCLIQPITVTSPSQYTNKYLSKKEKKQIPQERETFTQEDLESLAELNPPPLMPQGNVGTPTRFFMEQIQNCKLPPSIIKKLGLVFPKQRSNRIYSSVSFDYGGKVEDGPEKVEFTMKSSMGKDIVPEYSIVNEPVKAEESIEDRKEEDNADNESGEDADDCEEWERHEALHDEPRKGERNKERLFEEKIELKWEKGGSGLVFYTDAQHWKKLEGDFDEQTADDWDVDMSIYYEKDGGDMDARDFATMRRDMRRREGEEEDLTIAGQSFESKIGAFEQHTKAIGRKVMQQQGWVDGKGLGKTNPGMSDALDNDGQAPRNKAGLGYHGEKAQRFGLKRKHDPDKPIISTKYDDPEDTDPKEPLLRRYMPYHIKHRQLTDIQFVKPQDPMTQSYSKS